MGTATDVSAIETATGLRALVREHADEAEAQRFVPDVVVRALAGAGLYRLCAPAVFGGGEADPITTIKVIEAISAADGATGWALMIGIETVGLGTSLLAPEVAAALFAERPDLVMCGALNPQGRARRVAGGWTVDGTWPFASGCHGADFFWGQCIVEGSSPTELVEVLVPRADYRILDTWHVNGLRGSGSHDVSVRDVFVPDAMTTDTRSKHVPHDGPLFRLPRFSRLAYNKVGVSLGIARTALDEFTAIAEGKVPRLMSRSLRERPRAQLAVAQAEAILRSARAFCFEAVQQEWDVVVAGGVADRKHRAMVRLASSWACQEAVRAVRTLCDAAGTTPNFDRSLLGRCLRDVQVVPQQVMVAPHFIEDAGRVLLGLDPLEPIL
jgi:alkylation response protein AidB-like acyl-CoA dehydrogenase